MCLLLCVGTPHLDTTKCQSVPIRVCGVSSSPQIAAVLMLMAMAFFNALYIHDLVTHHKMLEAGFTDGAGLNADEGDHPTVGRHIVEEIKKEKQAKKLKIKVVSSKEEAKIFVNEKEVHTVPVCCTSALCFIANYLSLSVLSLSLSLSSISSCCRFMPRWRTRSSVGSMLLY